MRHTYLLLALLLISLTAKAQSSNYTFESLHRQRLKTNVTGMSILATWGAANLAAGGAGYFIANDDEWRAFHGMNAIWGATNLGIGILGTIGSKKDLRKTVNCDKMLSGYESTKRLFLVNAGLDVAYIGTGLMLHAKANNFNKPAEWRGFGKSIANARHWFANFRWHHV